MQMCLGWNIQVKLPQQLAEPYANSLSSYTDLCLSYLSFPLFLISTSPCISCKVLLLKVENVHSGPLSQA